MTNETALFGSMSAAKVVLPPNGKYKFYRLEGDE